MIKNILIIDEMHPSIVPGLKNIGLDVDYMPNIKREEILEIIHIYEGIIVRSKTEADKELINKASNLKYIARAGAGTDKIDNKLCEKKGIAILNAPEGNRDALGEHAAGMLLTLINKIHKADHEVRNGVWDRENNRGYELLGKTVGIIGYGNMGSAFARRLSGFDCKVLAYDKYKSGFSNLYVKEAGLKDLYLEADILSLHVPLTSETESFYNYEFFSQFKKDIILINTARGKILPLKDLVRLMEEGKIKGAALDVLENEKINTLLNTNDTVFQKLISRFDIVFTPHVGGWSYESYARINDVLVDKIKNFYAIND